MSVVVRFKKLDHSESLTEYIEEKIEKLIPHCRGEISAHFDISIQGRKKAVEFHFKTKLNSYYSKAFSEDYYLSVDVAVNKVLRQVKKHRQKMRLHKNYAVSAGREAA